MRRVLAAVAVLLAAGCTSTPGATTPPPAVSSATGFQSGDSDLPASVSPVAAAPMPLQVSDPGRVTGTLDGRHCHARGTPPEQLPDASCTPGAYDPKVTAAVLCAPSYTTRVYRPPASGPHGTTTFKYNQAYPAYGVAPGTPSELDHLINLDLGGSNDAANLWPEVGKVPNPKDAVEARLHQWVCQARGAHAEGRLATARDAIAADWITALQVTGAA